MTLFGLFGVVIHWLFLGAEGAVQQKQDFDRCSRSLHMCYMRWVPINSGSSSRSSRLLSSGSLLSSLARIDNLLGAIIFCNFFGFKKRLLCTGCPNKFCIAAYFLNQFRIFRILFKNFLKIRPQKWRIYEKN